MIYLASNTKSYSVASGYSIFNIQCSPTVCESMYGEGKEEELNKESNVADVGELKEAANC